MMRTMLLAGLALFAGAGDLVAQACWGSPAAMGQAAIEVGVSVTDGATGYGGGLDVNLEGPISIGAWGAITDFDDMNDNMTGFGGRLGIELPVKNVSVCPTLGGSYSMISTNEFGFDVDYSYVSLPLMMKVGHAFTTEDGLVVIPSAGAGYIHVRGKAEAGGETAKKTFNEFGSHINLALGWQQFFVSGGVSFSTFEESDPVFRLGLGVFF
jgi:hypothetical protein